MTITVRVAEPDHAWFRSILEAYEGLATWHCDGSGVFTLTSPEGRRAELTSLLDDLAREGSVQRLDRI